MFFMVLFQVSVGSSTGLEVVKLIAGFRSLLPCAPNRVIKINMWDALSMGLALE